jgi:hypothetical protein
MLRGGIREPRLAVTELLVSIVNRGTAGSVNLTPKLDGYPAAPKARVTTLTGPLPWTANTLADPLAIRPVLSEKEVRASSLVLTLPPCSVVQGAVPRN